MRRLFLFFLLLPAAVSFAQPKKKKLQTDFSFYAEPYYSFDYNKPEKNNRPGFLYSYNRHDEFTINLGLIRMAVSDSNFRFSAGLMTGTYSQYNLASEPEGIRNIYEASAGLKLSRRKNIWMDAGIFPSHIGFESAVGKDCKTLTRSIMAENTPYYESGVKISWISANEKWTYRLLVLNGWQRIQLKAGNSIPAAGTQIVFNPNDKISINSSSFVGHVLPDSMKQIRCFHNLYANWQLHPKFGITAGFDSGIQKRAGNQTGYANWLNPILIVYASPVKQISIAARAEYYYDREQTIITTGTVNGFQTVNFSVNADYTVSDHILLRVEARSMKSRDEIFLRNNLPVNDNFAMTGSVAFSF